MVIPKKQRLRELYWEKKKYQRESLDQYQLEACAMQNEDRDVQVYWTQQGTRFLS